MEKLNSIYTHFDTPVSKAKYSTPCTLWIPVHYEEFVISKLLDYKTFKCYLHYLILRCAPLIREMKVEPNLELKTKYQEKNIGFIVKTFRPFRYSDWNMLKIFASGLNVSRSYLVAMLIEMDMNGFIDKVVLENCDNIVTTYYSYITGYRELFIPKKEIFRRTMVNKYSPEPEQKIFFGKKWRKILNI